MIRNYNINEPRYFKNWGTSCIGREAKTKINITYEHFQNMKQDSIVFTFYELKIEGILYSDNLTPIKLESIKTALWHFILTV